MTAARSTGDNGHPHSAFAQTRHIVELAARHRLPAIYMGRAFVLAAGLMSVLLRADEVIQ